MVLEGHWVPILVAQAQIAKDPGNRNAVAAARFLLEAGKDAIEAVGGDEEEGVDHAFLKEFARMPGKKRATLEKKTKSGSMKLEVED
jgi:hypothetical protein